MNAHDDGGPAFPTHPAQPIAGTFTADPAKGMTLRDYFAAHSVQPGCGEIATLAGVTFRDGSIWAGPNDRIGSFDNWFNALPLDERLSLFARVKYAMADAMLTARQ